MQNLYLIHGTANNGRSHFCGVPVRAADKGHAMRKARREGLDPRGIRKVTRMPDIVTLASEEFENIARRLVS